MNLSFGYGKRGNDDEAFAILDRAVELGATFWDTSDIYADNEDLLRLWFERSGKRDQVFLCTKFGVSKDGIRSDAAYVKEACERSLERLGVDHIDLYYCHRVDMRTPIEETVKAMAELKQEGKIRHLGLSEISASTLRRGHAVHSITAVQMEYSAFALDIERPETNFLSTCRELGVTVVAYSPLGRGLLTGQLTSPDDFAEGDFRKTAPRFAGYSVDLTYLQQADYTIGSARRTSIRTLSL
jgi:aryl-alcohol dehydrogenase-like predicted oxidoreductase